MQSHNNHLKINFVRLLLVSAGFFLAGMEPLYANPDGGVVVAGDATISQNARTTTVNQISDRAIINWKDFSIKRGEITHFNQPNSNSIALNRVTSNNPSTILGTLSANGKIILINPNGILFGVGSVVDVASLVATTANISNENFLKDNYHFIQDATKNSGVINQGTIRVKDTGLAALVAPSVENNGVINAKLGKVILASGEEFTIIDTYGDNLIQFAASKSDSQPSKNSTDKSSDAVSNHGTIIADGGKVLLTLQAMNGLVNNTINMDGVIQANTVTERNGEIILSGGETGTVQVAGTLAATGKNIHEHGGKVLIAGNKVGLSDHTSIDVSGYMGGGEVIIGGDYQGKNPNVRNADVTYVAKNVKINADAIAQGNGGKIIVWADDTTRFYGTISARGGSEIGNGGFVEISGKKNLAFKGAVDTRAVSGSLGTLLLDPRNITIAVTQNSATLNEVDVFSKEPTTDYTVDPSVINAANTNIILQANNDINFNSDINLTSGVSLTAQAKRNINVNANITTNNADILLSANDLTDNTTSTRDAGLGGIYMASGTVLSAGTGNIILQVGNNVNAGDIVANTLTTTAGSIHINSPKSVIVNGKLTTAAGEIKLLGSTGLTINDTVTSTTGNINLSAAANADITVNADITTAGNFIAQDTRNLILKGVTAQSVLLNSQAATTLNGIVNGGNGTITINVNQAGTGFNSFVMNNNSSITTSNPSQNAVAIKVNKASGGNGAATLQNITTGSGGTISIESYAGAITRSSGTLNTGNNGVFNLSSTNNIGTSSTNLALTSNNGILNLRAGGTGAFINNTGNLTLASYALLNSSSSMSVIASGTLTLPTTNINLFGTGSLTLRSNQGELITHGNLSTSNGAMTLFGSTGLTIDHALTTNGGNINLSTSSSAPSDITINREITSNTGSLTINNTRSLLLKNKINTQGVNLTAQQNISLDNGIIDARSGVITINANQGGTGSYNFSMNNTSSMTTTNTTNQAVVIKVNNGNGSGSAALGNITSGNGGTITISTDNGSIIGGTITQLTNTQLDAGNSGTVSLATPTFGNSKITSTVFGGNLKITGNQAGVDITSNNDLTLLGATLNQRAPLTINVLNNKALTLSTEVKTGLVKLNATNININKQLTGYGPMLINADLGNSGNGKLQVANGAGISSSNFDIGISASSLVLNGTITSGLGQITINNTRTSVMDIGGSFISGNQILYLTHSANTGGLIFNSKNGIQINTALTTYGDLTLNADVNNTGAVGLSVANNIVTNNHSINIFAGSVNLGASTLNAGAGTLAITAIGSDSSIGLGTTAGGKINFTDTQLNQLNAKDIVFNANKSITVSTNYSTNSSLTFNADLNNDGQGQFTLQNNITVDSQNNALDIVAGGLSLGNGKLKSGTGSFSLTATGASSYQPSLGLGTTANGLINLSDSQLTNQIIATGARTYRAKNGINVTSSNIGSNALTLNADYTNSGTGLLSFDSNLTIKTNDQALNLTAATLNLGTNTLLNSGNGAFTLTATGILVDGYSLAIGNGVSGKITLSETQFKNQIIANGARTFNGRLGLNINVDLNNLHGLTLNADYDNNGQGYLNIAAGKLINSGNESMNIIAATGSLNNNALQHGSGALTITATGLPSSQPSLGLGNNANGLFNISTTELNNFQGDGAITFNGKNGITVNQNFTNNAGATTLTFNADTDRQGIGTFTINNGVKVDSANKNISITAADINLLGKITSGNADIIVNATSSLGVGNASSGTMILSNTELANFAADKLTLNTQNNFILVDGVSTPAIAGIKTTINLNANALPYNPSVDPNTLRSTVEFANNASNFKTLNVQAASGIKLNTNITATDSVTLGKGPDTGLNFIRVGNNVSVNAANDITINNSAGWAKNLTLTLKANSDNNAVGNVIIGDNISLGQGSGNLAITAKNLAVGTNATINLGNTGNLILTATSAIEMGDNAVGSGMSLNNSTLQKITANNLTINSGANSGIVVDNVTTTNAVNNINGLITLNAINGNSNTNIVFTNGESKFNSLAAVANQGINIKTNLTVNSTLSLTANGASNIVQDTGTAVIGTATNSTLTLKTTTGAATLTNLNNSFANLTANSTSGTISYTNSNNKDLNVNASNVSSGSLTLTTQGIGKLKQSGALVGNTLVVKTDTGSASLTNTSNNFANFTANSGSGAISYTNLNNKDLNVTASDVGSGSLLLTTQGTGKLTQTGALQGNALSVKTDTGSADLTNTNNNFDIFTANSTSGAISYTNLNDLNVAASNVGSGSLSLTAQATGKLTQTGALVGNTLNVKTGTGNADLTNNNNSFANFNANSTSGTIKYTNINNKDLNITASNVGSGNLTLKTQGTGKLTQTGALQGDILTVKTDSGSADFTNGNNSFATFTADSTNGAISYTNLNDLNVSGSNVGSGSLTLRTQGAGALTQTGLLQGNTLNIKTDAGSANLINSNNSFINVSVTSSSGNMKYANNSTINVNTSDVGTGSLNISAAANDIVLTGGLSGKAVDLVAETGGINLNHQLINASPTGTISLTAHGITSNIENSNGLISNLLNIVLKQGTAELTGTVAELTVHSDGGNVNYTNSVGHELKINYANLATGNLTINLAGNNLTQLDAITGNTLTLNLNGGSANLNQVNNLFKNLDGGNTRGSIVYTNANNINLQNINLDPIHGNLTINVLNANNITQTTALSGNSITLNTVAGNAYLSSSSNSFGNLTANSTSGTINYRGNEGFKLGTSILNAGNLNLYTATGDISQTGKISGKALTVNSNTGNVLLVNADNVFESFQANTENGNVIYNNAGNLNLLTSNVGMQGNLTVSTSAQGNLNLLGNLQGQQINLTAANNLALYANALTASDRIILNANNNITGQSLNNFPKLMAPTIQITAGNQVASIDAPIGLNVNGLKDDSFIQDASNQTGLGIIISYENIIDNILMNTTNEFYLYPLISKQQQPENEAVQMPSLFDGNLQAQNVCTPYDEFVDVKFSSNQLIPRYCNKKQINWIKNSFEITFQPEVLQKN